MSAQLIFDLPVRPALNRHDFMVSPCNGEAVALIDKWCTDGEADDSTISSLYGPAGCGKSHLVAVLAREATLGVVPVADIACHAAVKAALADKSPPAIIALEGLDALRPRDEEILFHLLNATTHNKNRLLMTATTAPAQLAFRLPDLMSRLRAVPAIAMRAPDDKLLSYLLFKLFSDRQIAIDEKIVAYLVPRVERSYAALAKLVAGLDHAALTQKRPITIPLVAAYLGAP